MTSVQTATSLNQPMSTRTFKCIKCKKDTFKTAEALASHQAALEHYPVVCPKCNKEFASKNALKQHKSIHKQKSVSSQKSGATPTTSTAGTPAVQPARMAVVPQQKHQPQPSPRKRSAVVTGLAKKAAPINQHIPQPQPHRHQQQQQQQQEQSMVLQGAEYLEQAFSHIDIPSLGHYDNPISEPGGDQQKLYHNGHYFTLLSGLEQDLLFKYLLARCHPPARLRVQGYQLPTDPQNHKIPQKPRAIKRSQFLETPRPTPGQRKRRAVVLDCEMVEVRGYQRELAFLSAVDFLTGEVLINKYVEPTAKVTSWNSKVSGITASKMNKAAAKGQTLRGWPAARDALWGYIDEKTILVGHSLNSDLNVLGMLHWRIVDSSILTGESVFITEPQVPLRRLWSLKKLTSTFLDMEIQNSPSGHDCLEDTLATRDVVIWCLRNPEHLRVWADIARAQDRIEQEEREAKRQEKERKRKEKEMQEQEEKKKLLLQEQLINDQTQASLFGASADGDEEDFNTDISEILRCSDIEDSDIAENLGWSHPGTGYDLWSD